MSNNTGDLRCPVCDGTGSISLDVQFLPDVEIPCPECRGSRYSKEAWLIRRTVKKSSEAYSLPELMDMSVDEAMKAARGTDNMKKRWRIRLHSTAGKQAIAEHPFCCCLTRQRRDSEPVAIRDCPATQRRQKCLRNI